MKKRRSQKERSETTRRKLLDAATSVLIEEGYANLTTTKVCQGAGVSQGALFKHFPTKMMLLASLAEDLYSGLARDFEKRFDNMPPGVDVIHSSIQYLWEVFSSKRQLASYDLTIAGRTDPDLKQILDPIVIHHRNRIQKIAGKISRKINMERTDFFALADIILMAIQGCVMNRLAYPEEDQLTDRLSYLEELAKKMAATKGDEKK